MNNDLIARRLKPPTPAAASLPSSPGPQPPGPQPPAPPPFAPQPAPYAPQSTPFERSDVPWDRPAEPEPAMSTEPTVEQDRPPTPEWAVELPPTLEPQAVVEDVTPVDSQPVLPAAVADVEPPDEPEAIAEVMLSAETETTPAQPEATAEPDAAAEFEATVEPMLPAQPETSELDVPDAVASTTPWPPTLADLLAEATTRFNGDAEELTADAAAAFVPDAEFVSVVPPWESPPDEAWLVDVEPEGEPAIAAAAPPTAEPEYVEPEPEPPVEMAEVRPEPGAELAAEPLAELSEPVDEVVDASPSLDLRLPDVGTWAPHAPETAPLMKELAPDGNTAVVDEAVLTDPNDAFAPIAEDLFTAETIDQPTQWPDRDIAATLIVAHQSGDTDQFAPAAQDAEIAGGAHPDTQAVVHESLLAWEPAPAGPSVFGEMLAAVEPPLAAEPPPSDAFAALPDETAEPMQPEVFAVMQPEPPLQPPSPVDWPPVPTGVFPPLPDALPTLNVESTHEGIEWPDEPRPQTFWPADDDPWVPAPPALATDDPPVEPELRFVPPPTAPDPGRGLAAERPRLVFSDPPLPSAERDERDGVLTRIGNQATALAERLPDGWSLPTSPPLASTNEEAMARDLNHIQSPTLTVLFAMVAIAAVLLFIYLATPLLR